jgi:hypothetical protein
LWLRPFLCCFAVSCWRNAFLSGFRLVFDLPWIYRTKVFMMFAICLSASDVAKCNCLSDLTTTGETWYENGSKVK